MRLRAALLCALISSSAFAADTIRPISYAERAAVQLAASYLARGPEAVHDRLASVSPLKKLSKADALAEIEVRLGPPAGATWELQTVVPALKDETAVFAVSYPSGADETVVLNLAAEDGDFKVNDIRILAEPSATQPIFAPLEANAAKPVKKTNPNTAPLATGLAAALLAGGAMFVAARSGSGARAMIAIAIVAVGAGGYIAFDRTRKAQEAAAAAALQINDVEDYPRLGKLLPFRRAIAAGTDVAAAAPPFALKGAASQVAKLWNTQLDLEQMRVDSAARALKGESNPSQTPLAEILRGRLAFSQAKETDSVIAYEHAVNLGPGRDGLWVETAQVLETLGFNERAERYFKRLSKIGSRDANVYYSLAVLAALHGHDDDAVKALKTAWALRPIPREQLVGTQILYATLRRPEIVGQIKLSSAAEATFASEHVSTRAIQLPEGALPRVSGEFLHVQIGDAELLVPGGAPLAPIGTRVVDAGLWSRDEDQKSLADFAHLAPHAKNAGSYTQPQLRRRILRTAESLANHNRWSDLVQLTDGLSPRSEHVPADVFFLRAIALQRLKRDEDAKVLLLEMVRNPSLQRRNDAQQFVTLGNLLSQMDQFDAAVKVLDKAASMKREYSTGVDEMVAKITMNKRLATKYQTYRTQHFEIRFPDDVAPTFAQQMADILEKELKREQKWVLTPNFQQIVVNVVWWRDFRATYTGSDFILGFYQSNKITIPFAGIPGFYPEITSIMSHELAHAMIAQATNDQAPHWFQEGLAQRVEMVQYKANAFNMYEDDRLLSVSVLDAVLQGSPDPEMIGEAYIVAHTIIRFIEASYGQNGINTMLGAFRDGATTDEAIQKLSGLSVTDFDTKLRAWGRAGTKIFENHELIDYSVEGGQDLRWSTGRRGSSR
jgi:tetratricopeptide (TPR) repeat protein